MDQNLPWISLVRHVHFLWYSFGPFIAIQKNKNQKIKAVKKLGISIAD